LRYGRLAVRDGEANEIGSAWHGRSTRTARTAGPRPRQSEDRAQQRSV